ncbi:hypothetical protein K461DRAFT_232672 [Myriangium duriaei CBS 260.36]|uniref:ribonuclease Z n=1 Tax=Myriangium duriaei CBS 260.36 TaxID=1168546 RepID=A0A9P4IXH9_9PEZI|nr:hypothetical protein K461DRAFT_232672 [Myriangium duriaei CBS 260.36]
MKAFFQFLTTPTSDTNGTSLLLHFDQKRYIFGSLTEGTQRATVQQGVRTQKVSEIFISGRTEWRNVGGLLGFILTIADTASEAASSAKDLLRAKAANLKDDQKKQKLLSEEKKKQEQKPRLTIFGPGNLNYMLATARRFIFRTSMPLIAKEIPHLSQSRPADEVGPAVFAYQDENIRVWALAVAPESTDAASPRKNERKRSHDDMTGVEGQADTMETNAHDAATKIVKEMFNSDWRIDRLFECSINEVKLPARCFIRDPETKQIKAYTGPFPSQGNPVPDVKVLVRSPWPGAVMTPRLPMPETCEHSVSYIVKTWPQRGKFDPQKATALGLTDKSLFGRLTRGESLQNVKGETITPEMVMAPTREGTGFIVADIPSLEYVRPFLQQQAAVPESTMSNLSAYIWLLGPGLTSHPDLVAFMHSTKHLKHLITAPDVCPDRLSFDAAAAATAKLAAVDPFRYRHPVVRDSALPIAHVDSAIVADRGLTLQMEPAVKLTTDEINAPIDYDEVAEALSDEARSAAKMALEELSKENKALDSWANKLIQPDTEIVTLGTGSALPSKYRNVSGTLIKVPGWGNLLLDCGEDTIGQLKRVFPEQEYLKAMRSLKTIWISHLHADHHLGTASVVKEWYSVTHNLRAGEDIDPTSGSANLGSTASTDGRLTIMSDSAMLHWLWEYSRVEDIGFSYINPICVTAATPKHKIDTRLNWFNPQLSDANPGTKFQLQDRVTGLRPSDLNFTDIQSVYVRHCNGAQAVSLTLPSGLKISYSGDCRPSADFATIGKDSTVCIHEATFDDELQSDAKAKNHSTTSEALSVATKMNAKAVVLTHFSQRYAKVPVLEYTDEDEANDMSIPDEPVEEDAAPDNAAPALADEAAQGMGKSTFRLKADADMKVCVAFDYMRVRLGDIAQMEKFVPALLALYDGEEDGRNDKQREKQRGQGSARAGRKKKKQGDQPPMENGEKMVE